MGGDDDCVEWHGEGEAGSELGDQGDVHVVLDRGSHVAGERVGGVARAEAVDGDGVVALASEVVDPGVGLFVVAASYGT